jgi:hypothetical protein
MDFFGKGETCRLDVLGVAGSGFRLRRFGLTDEVGERGVLLRDGRSETRHLTIVGSESGLS